MPLLVYNNIPFPETDLSDPGSNFVLGQFMTAWSQVESLCGFLFRELSQITPEIANTIFDRIQVRDQIKILSELVKRIEVPDRRELAVDTMKEVEKLSVSRNKIVHAGWGHFDGEPARFSHGLTDQTTTEIVRETPKGKADRVRLIFTLPDISALTKHSIQVRDTLREILDQTVLDKVRADDAKREERWTSLPGRGPQGSGQI